MPRTQRCVRQIQQASGKRPPQSSASGSSVCQIGRPRRTTGASATRAAATSGGSAAASVPTACRKRSTHSSSGSCSVPDAANLVHECARRWIALAQCKRTWFEQRERERRLRPARGRVAVRRGHHRNGRRDEHPRPSARRRRQRHARSLHHPPPGCVHTRGGPSRAVGIPPSRVAVAPATPRHLSRATRGRARHSCRLPRIQQKMFVVSVITASVLSRVSDSVERETADCHAGRAESAGH